MNIEKGINMFWFVFGLLVVEESYRLNLGEFHRPDSGFFPFFIGMVITGLSSILLIQAFRSKSQKEGREEKKQEINYKNILLTLLALYTYAIILEWLGFISTTFLLIFFLLKIVERKAWAFAIVIALLTTLCSYVLFKVLLHAPLPMGIFGR